MKIKDLIKRLEQLDGDQDIYLDVEGDINPDLVVEPVEDQGEVIGYCFTRNFTGDELPIIGEIVKDEPEQLNLPFDTSEDTKGNK